MSPENDDVRMRLLGDCHQSSCCISDGRVKDDVRRASYRASVLQDVFNLPPKSGRQFRTKLPEIDWKREPQASGVEERIDDAHRGQLDRTFLGKRLEQSCCGMRGA